MDARSFCRRGGEIRWAPNEKWKKPRKGRGGEWGGRAWNVRGTNKRWPKKRASTRVIALGSRQRGLRLEARRQTYLYGRPQQEKPNLNRPGWYGEPTKRATSKKARTKKSTLKGQVLTPENKNRNVINGRGCTRGKKKNDKLQGSPKNLSTK